jgi:hypothetical protein
MRLFEASAHPRSKLDAKAETQCVVTLTKLAALALNHSWGDAPDWRHPRVYIRLVRTRVAPMYRNVYTRRPFGVLRPSSAGARCVQCATG